MGVRILTDRVENKDVMYDSVTGLAFGPVLDEDEGDEFLSWLDEPLMDARRYSNDDLVRLVEEWRRVKDGPEPDGSRYLGGGNYGATSR